MTEPQVAPERQESSSYRSSQYNNAAICAAALMAVIEECKDLSLAKSLLVMPLIMHDATVHFLGDQRTRERGIAALVALRPDLFANFNSRFVSGLPHTLNAIQLLTELKYVSFGQKLTLYSPLVFSKALGERALRIKKASPNIAALLSSPEDELYLNLRIVL
jgi:hypothetical protein